MSKIGKKMSFPIPLVLKIIILFDWGVEPLSLSLGTRILILNSIEGEIIFNFHWFLKDEKAVGWKEGFPQFPLDKKKQVQGGS
jgi:hypothetical protein